MKRAIDPAVESVELHAAVFGPAVKAAPTFSSRQIATEEGWAFEEHLQASIATQPGETFEERIVALANVPEWEWLNDPIPLTRRATKAFDAHQRWVGNENAFDRAKLCKSLRKKLGLIQAEAAERMGLARTTVVAIEQGKRGVSVEELAKLDPSTAVEGGAS